MKVLALDGALGAFSVAAAVDGSVAGARSETGNVALERGLSLVAQLLAESGLRPGDLDRIAVGCGPGGFTGLRIAIAYAKSLAQAWSRPLVAIDSFDLLEFGSTFARVLAVVEGRPGVVSLRYRDGLTVARASGWIAQALDEISSSIDRHVPLPVVGAPKDVLAALAERGIIVRPVDRKVTPVAAAAALLAASRPPAASLHEVRADYGELPAAKIPKLAKPKAERL